MQDLETANFFTDESPVDDSIPYFNALRSKYPMLREPHYGAWVVTGYDEGLAVYKQADDFSSCLAVSGPIPGLPFKPEGDDIAEQIRQHHHQVPWATHFITFDGPGPTARRTLMTRLLTNERLKKNAA